MPVSESPQRLEPQRAVPQDPVDHARICNKGDDVHAGAAGSASPRVSPEDSPNRTSPRAAGFAAGIATVPVLGCSGGIAAVPMPTRGRDPAPG